MFKICLAAAVSTAAFVCAVSAQELSPLPTSREEINLTCNAAGDYYNNEVAKQIEPLGSEGSSTGSSSAAMMMPRWCHNVEGEVTVASDVSSPPFDRDDPDSYVPAINRLRAKLGIPACKTPEGGCDCILFTGKCKPEDLDETSGSTATVDETEDSNGMTTLTVHSNGTNTKLKYELECWCHPDGYQH